MELEVRGTGDIIFLMIIMWLLIISMAIFTAIGDNSCSRRLSKMAGLLFIGGKGCGCGGCRYGVGVCGTYLS
ncbi:hypothetical protein KFK09_026693 [Dendrobium nobile]|uniref:Transmembrane protein n=1 Tax=Dendrobium nobile TaxID=94219 RepID=A0A8T3A8V3_DENNO|nr:hypothetical protein KFK09_026693 [Dendrobium nobile]